MGISRRSFLKTAAAAGAITLLPRWARGEDVALDGLLPIRITSPGRYVLNSNQQVNLDRAAAIDVAADNVEIDLQGFSIENRFGDGTVSAGVAAVNRSRIWVHGGTLRGFYAGIFLVDHIGSTHGHRLENCTLADCMGGGVIVSGNGCVIAQNTITNVGGTVYCPPVLCSVALGIGVVSSFGCLIKGNTIVMQDAGPGDGSVGICVSQAAQNVIVLSNNISNADIGLAIADLLGGGGEYRDNTVQGTYSVAYTGGADIGNNRAI